MFRFARNNFTSANHDFPFRKEIPGRNRKIFAGQNIPRNSFPLPKISDRNIVTRNFFAVTPAIWSISIANITCPTTSRWSPDEAPTADSGSGTHSHWPIRCPAPDHPPCQIIPHPLAQSASAPGSCKMCYDSLFRTLRLAACLDTEIRCPMPDHPPSANTECFSTREL